MAPPRNRGANIDDSRSEASSGPRERQAAGAKARRLGNAAVVAAANKDVKSTLPTAAGGDPEPGTGENLGINWSTMPLSVLHQYRYVHNLPSSSSFSSQINSILLSQGVGLRSPTAIAIRNAQRAAKKSSDKQKTGSQQHAPPLSPPARPSSSSAAKKLQSKGQSEPLHLHRTLANGPAQGRVSKEHLASAVRKHFNNTAISEQDAIARFVYKVSEERKGKAFRLRFQP